MDPIPPNQEQPQQIINNNTQSTLNTKFIENSSKKSNTIWKIISIMLILIGVGYTVYFLITRPSTDTNFPLEKKSFSLGGKNTSLLLPKDSKRMDFEESSTFSVISYVHKNVYLPGIMVLSINTPKSPISLDCAKLGKPIIFTADIYSLNKSVDICEDPSGFSKKYPAEKLSEYNSIGTSGFNHDNSDKQYVIEIVVKKDYLQTEEGKTKVKQIIESFNIE